MAFNSFCLERDVGESQAESDRVMEAQSTSKVKKNTQTAAVRICPVTQQQWTNSINYSGEEEGGPKQAAGQTTSRLISSEGRGSPGRQGEQRSTVGKKFCG